MAPSGERRPGGAAGRVAGVRVGGPCLPLSRASRSSAVDSRTGAKVAIKKLYRPFQSELFAKRAYRELRLLKHMRHENVSRAGPSRPAASVASARLPAPRQILPCKTESLLPCLSGGAAPRVGVQVGGQGWGSKWRGRPRPGLVPPFLPGVTSGSAALAGEGTAACPGRGRSPGRTPNSAAPCSWKGLLAAALFSGVPGAPPRHLLRPLRLLS